MSTTKDARTRGEYQGRADAFALLAWAARKLKARQMEIYYRSEAARFRAISRLFTEA